MNRIALLLGAASLFALGCTFNASWLDRDVEAGADPGRYEVLSVAATSRGSALDGTSVRVVGSARPDSSARAHLVGILGVNDDADAIVRRFTVAWARVDDATMSVSVDAFGGAPERVRIDELVVELPSEREVVLQTDDGSIRASGVARVEAIAGSGSIVVADVGIVELTAGSGSIHASGEAGNVHTESGSIVLDLGRWVDASAESGSIVGTIGGGGSIATSSGSIDVELRGALDRDLLLTADSGSIVLGVPRGASMTLDLEASGGSVAVEAGGVRHGGDRFQGVVREGGFTVWARTGSGSIVVVER